MAQYCRLFHHDQFGRDLFIERCEKRVYVFLRVGRGEHGESRRGEKNARERGLTADGERFSSSDKGIDVFFQNAQIRFGFTDP